MANSRWTQRRSRRAKIIVACAVGPIVAALARSAPAGVQLSNVAAGSASVSQQGAVTTIRTGTNNTILYFSKFDIAGGSTVNFMQPSAAGRVLDHVTSATPSLINGTIQSNGAVYLVNPAGVIFGASAVVDVNRFYAAAASFSNQDFLNGIDHFTGVSGMVSNSGQIRANQVSLIGSQVMNAGNIIAPNGYVAMLAGSDVLVSEEGSHITAKVVSASPIGTSSTPLGGAASSAPDLRNSAMAAGDVYSLAIRHTGVIQARNVLINGGGGQVQISGSIDASTHAAGGVGGNVAITGAEVNLVSANINASGPAGGGSVEIGGGVHGSGDLTHAQIVSVDSSSTIDADAISNGPGGSIALWSDGLTTDAATLTARGGAIGGTGGYIETSGDFLQVYAAPNASAPHGSAGTWVMDPIDIDIQNGTGTGVFTGSVVFNTDIDTALNGGTNVVIDTSNQTNGTDTGTLMQESDAIISVAPTLNVTLTLRANADMTLQGGITATGSSTLSVELDQLNSAGNAVLIETHPISINGTLNVVGGNLSVTSGITAAGVTIGSGTVVADSGSVNLTLGTVSATAAIATTGSGPLSITTATSITTSTGGTISTSGGTVTLTAVGPISIGDTVQTGAGTFSATGGTFANSGTGSITTVDASVTVSSSGLNSIGAAISTGGGAFAVTGGTGFTSTAAIGTSGGNVTISTAGADSIGAAVTTGGGKFVATGWTTSFTTTAAGSIDTTGAATDEVDISGTGPIFIGDTIHAGAGGIFLDFGNSASPVATAGGAITVGGIITSGGSFSAGGTTFTSDATDTITTSGGVVTISATGADSIGAAVATGGGKFLATTWTTSFTTTAAGSISTTGSTTGEVDISGLGPISIGDNITTGGAGIFIDFGSSGGPPAATHGGSVSIGAPIATAGGVFSSGGTTFTSSAGSTATPAGSIAAGSGAVTISTTGAVSIGAAIGAGAFTENGATTFTSLTGGTITTTGGAVSITTSTSTTLGAIVTTNGGAFTAVAGLSFENDAPITVGTGTSTSNAFSVSTAGSGSIDINGAISWAGAGGVTIFGPQQVSTTSAGTITSAGGVMPVSLLSTIVEGSLGTTGVTVGGGITTSGAFTGSGGNFILSQGIGITAASLSVNIVASLPGTPPQPTTTPGTVTISGPVVASTGAIDIGGIILFTDNGTGTLTTTNKAIDISNSGLIALGDTVMTSGGSFTVDSADNFTSSSPISTGGGNVSITTTTSDGIEISSGAPINTGGGSFTASAQTFRNDSNITDGGAAVGPGVVTIDTTTGTLADTLNGSIIWTGGTGRSVVVEGGGDVTVTNITASGPLALPVSLFTTGTGNTVSIIGPVTASGAFIGSGANFSITSAGSLNAQIVTLNINTTAANGHAITPGAVTVAGPVVTNDGVFTAGGTEFTSSGTGSITTNGGDVDLLTTGTIAPAAAINTGGGAFNVTLDDGFASTTGGVITTVGGPVTINSSGSVSVGDQINTGGGSFSSTAGTFASSGEITDGGVNNGQSVSITTTGGDITLNTGGDINWSASLGAISFVVPGGSVLNLGATITANVAEPINFTSVTLALVGTTATVSGGNVTFGTIANPDDTKTPTLIVEAAGTVRFGIVATSASPIGALKVTNNGSSAQPVTTLTGNIFVVGDVDFGGSVDLAANVAITASDIPSTSTTNNAVDHLLEFDGTIEGPQGLTLTLPPGGQNVEEVRFNSNIGDQTPLASLAVTSGGPNGFVFFRGGPPVSFTNSRLGELPGANDPQPATVVDIASGGSFKINDAAAPVLTSQIYSSIGAYGPLTINIGSASTPNAANLFAVGQYQKITSYGNLTINTNGGTAQVGDLSAFGNLTVNAANVVFVLRTPTFEGSSALDKGVDLIANGEMSLPAEAAYSAIAPSGAGAFGVPGFLARSFAPGSNISTTAGSLKSSISIVPPIPPTALFFPVFNLLLDLTPATLGAKLPNFIPPIPFVFDLPIAGAVPRQQLVAGTVTPDFKDAFQQGYPGPLVQQDLKDNGVLTREPSLEEVLAATDTIVDYNDMPRRRRPRAQDFAVAVTRLNSVRVQKFLDDYQQVFSSGQGKSTESSSRRAQMAVDLQESWDAYVSQNGYKQASGAGFEQYVATTPSASKASAELIQLNSLLQEMDTLGLSHKEAQMFFQHNILAGLPANGMQDGDLMAAVESAGNGR
jgi:filamentous hemagglutinin family protein